MKHSFAEPQLKMAILDTLHKAYQNNS